jgi:hypothetical protein
MLKKRSLLIIIGLAAILLPRPAPASWIYVPLEELIVQAEFVVSGKITEVEENEGLTFGTITADKVLKGPKDLKTVKIAWASKPTPSNISYKKGQEGVWLLNKVKDRDWYMCNHPGNFQPPIYLTKVEKLIRDIAAWEWGKEVNGLAVHLSVTPWHSRYPASVRLYMKNCSKKTLLILNHAETRPVQAEIIDPDGKQIKVDFYDWVKKADLRAISKHDFHPLAPGQVKCFTMQYRGSFNLESLTKKGEYRITATLTNKEDGKRFKLKDVWIGKAVSNTAVYRKK